MTDPNYPEGIKEEDIDGIGEPIMWEGEYEDE